MRHALRAAVTLIVAGIVTAIAACSQVSNDMADAPSPVAQATTDPRADSLLGYVEAERAQLPKLMDLYPGMYSEVRVEGTIEEQNGDRGIPAGTYAVVWFYYTYANEMDWSTTIDGLDAQRSSIDELCRTAVFPAIKTAGVTGPMSVVYSYDDGRSQFGPLWTHTCTA